VNPIAAKLLNIQSGEVVGQEISQLVSAGGAPLGEMYREATTRGPDAEPLQRQFSLGNEEDLRSLTATASPFGRGVVFVIDDVTHLTKAQREAAWREVARRIAHEIKNPLTPIKLSAQRMQKRLANVSGPDALVFKECTETIIQNVDELRDMVNEFSSFARFPSANPAPHNLNKALKEVVTLYAAAHKDIRITLDAESRMPVVDFDRDQIKRAIINLLDNAVAVAPTTITVSTHYNERLRIAVIDVEDNGPGIPETVRNRLFEPYFSTKQGGTGLGLSIVKRIIADHSGFIRVHSQPGGGAKFTIELPINLVAEKAKGSTVYGEDSTGG
jgi:two-component system nitrogen regulation sensor histidine kinase NtrY